MLRVRDAHRFQFSGPGSDRARQFDECPATFCANVTLSADEDGNTVQVVTAGPNAWTAYVVDADSGTVSANTMTASTSADGVALYTFSNITVSETGEVIPAVDSSSSGSNAGDDGDSGTLIIVVARESLRNGPMFRTSWGCFLAYIHTGSFVSRWPLVLILILMY